MNTKIMKAILTYTLSAVCLFSGCTVKQKNEVTQEKTSEMPTVSSVDNPILFAKLQDRDIAYRTIGKGEPIILCNRFRGNLDSWDPAFLDSLASKGYQVVTFDYRGFASSSGKPAEKTIEWVDDVRGLAEALRFEKFIVGGWSIGGFVAQVLTTEYPELVTHTILIGTKPPGEVKHQVEEIFIKTAWKPEYSLEDETILFFEPASEKSTEASRLSHERIAKRTQFKDKVIEEPLWANFIKGADDFTKDPYNSRSKLMITKIPILVISADHEVCFPPQNWFELTRKLPTTEMIVFPQAGHGPQHQLPGYTAGLIDNFIKEN